MRTDARITGNAASSGRRNSPIVGFINRLRSLKTPSQSRKEVINAIAKKMGMALVNN
ncbi:MAG: hypothetical protein F6K61_07975 [Sphaerospermopsis sp. SIO1G1]|nr:hypothetical protein [Sphaerospermopsis sp. SIO1G1]